MIVNWLLTRRCNRRCSFCGIVHDPMNKSLKKIKDITYNEINLSDVFYSILAMNRVYGSENLFHIFYGGEPFLKEGFNDFIKCINDYKDNIMYTVITNASMPEKVLECYKHAGQYKGLTVSLDPMIMETDHIVNKVKNTAAFQLLDLNKDKKLTNDMVVECMFDRNNIKYAKEFFDMMNVFYPDVTISVSFYDYPKSLDYDFALNKDATTDFIESMRVFPRDKNVINLKKLISSGKYNIHLGRSKKFIESVIKTCDSTYYCGLVHPVDESNKDEVVKFKTLTIDADGEFRLCLRVSGKSGLYVGDIFNVAYSKEELNENIKKLYFNLYDENYTKYCRGCSWTCPMMDEYASEQSDVAHNQINHGV